MLIAHLSDLHIRPHGKTANRVVETNAMADRAVATLAAMEPAPDAVIVTGDIAESGRADEYAVFREIIDGRLPCPVHVGIGNHDRHDNFRAALGDLPGVTDDAGFVQYTTDIGDIRLIMLDSVVPGAGHGELCAHRLDFLDAALDDAADRPVLIGLHHPPVETGIASMDAIRLHAPERMLDRVRRHGNVLGILCGHHHRTIISQRGGATLLAAPALGGHQSEVRFDADAPSRFHLEPGGWFLLRIDAEPALNAHLMQIGDFPGPYPFVAEADYPGRSMTAD